MPGPYSSDHSLRDAREMAQNLGIHFEIVSICGVFDRFIEALARVRELDEEHVLVCLSGRGDKDLAEVLAH